MADKVVVHTEQGDLLEIHSLEIPVGMDIILNKRIMNLLYCMKPTMRLCLLCVE